MIVDTSAILAILLDEPERERYRTLITGTTASVSAASLVELQAVLTRRFGGQFDDQAARLLKELRMIVLSVTAEQAVIGRDAYRTYGVGTGHPAHLNYGDCFAYALSKATGEPLLFKGDDFIHTDVARAVA